jgi:hypothetical protein
MIPLTDRMRDLRGHRSGRLVAIQPIRRLGRHIVWSCQCDCGKRSEVSAQSLVRRTTKSCGCFKRELAAENSRRRMTTHGRSGTLEYGIWSTIIDRCENQKSRSYADYGARGIAMCSEWRQSFERFIHDMGPRPSANHSVERIDNDKGYSPGNCRWATSVEQGANKRNNRILSFRGEQKTISQWSRVLGVSPASIRSRLGRGWTVDQTLGKPFGKPKSRGWLARKNKEAYVRTREVNP